MCSIWSTSMERQTKSQWVTVKLLNFIHIVQLHITVPQNRHVLVYSEVSDATNTHTDLPVVSAGSFWLCWGSCGCKRPRLAAPSPLLCPEVEVVGDSDGAVVGRAKQRSMSCTDKVLVEKRGHARLISDNSVTKGHRTGKMGWSELIFHGFDHFPELSGIRATGCKFVQEMRNFGFSDRLGAFVSTLPKGKPIGRRLGRMGFSP